MKKIILFLIVVTFSISCSKSVKKENKTEVKNIETTDKIVENPVLALADFDDKAAKWVNKEVEVNGIVDHVCKHGGKKLLLVNDNGDVHVVSETRFDDKLIGDEITLTGVVKEFKVDEAYCLQKEEDHMQNHKEGTDSDDVYAQKMEQIKTYRDSMKVAGVDHLSFYSLDYVSHQVKK
ncbi:MAG: hypothetical protein J7K34_10810 [Flavobacteriaceae bacterium]|nr:hypothetical protein [Flavobacteriaceae bacterium]